MSSNSSYLLVFNGHFYYLYEKQKKKIELLCIENTCDMLIEKLKVHSVKTLSIFDHTFNQTIKIETIPRKLNFNEYFTWYWQKRKIAHQQFEFGITRPLLALQGMLTVGLTESTQLTQIQQKMRENNISVSFFSYTLGLAYELYKGIKRGLPEINCPLLIMIDRTMRMTISFFGKKGISFIRVCHPSSQQPLAQQFKTAISDTLKFLEKTVQSDQIKLIFCIEGQHESLALNETFLNAKFFYRDQLIDFFSIPKNIISDTIFDLILFNEKFDNYLLRPYQKNSGMHLQILRHLAPLIKFVNIFVFLVSLYLAYDIFNLIRKNYILFQQIKTLETKLPLLVEQLENFPISASQVVFINQLISNAKEQQEKLAQFIDLLSHVFGSKYILRSLFIDLKKVQLVIDSKEFDESFDELLNIWQQTFADTKLITPPSDKSSPLIIELLSPFYRVS